MLPKQQQLSNRIDGIDGIDGIELVDGVQLSHFDIVQTKRTHTHTHAQIKMKLYISVVNWRQVVDSRQWDRANGLMRWIHG